MADLVAGQATRLGGDDPARLEGGQDLAALGLDGLRGLHIDLVGRAGRGAQVGQVADGEYGDDAGQRGHRPALRPPLGVAVVERQQEQQDHADRRDADGGQRRQLRRLDDP